MFNEETIRLSEQDFERILSWASAVCRYENYRWTRDDAKIYFLIIQTIKKINKINLNDFSKQCYYCRKRTDRMNAEFCWHCGKKYPQMINEINGNIYENPEQISSPVNKKNKLTLN